MLQKINNLIKSQWSSGSRRTKLAIKNIVVSLMTRSIGIIVPLLIVPMTIHYVNPEQYGIWLSLSSIIAWVSFFDLGLGNGFRNKFTQAVAEGNEELARQYVSTTYFALFVLILVVLVIIQVINIFISWSTILDVDISYQDELRKVFAVLAFFFCSNLVLNIYNALMSADQHPAYGSIVHGIGQVCSLLSIFILTKVSSGSLLNLAIFFSGVPTIVLLLATIVTFRFTRYKKYAPSYKYVNVSLIKNILVLGIKFFIIGISAIVIFQITNIVISRELGPVAVTQYNIAYKYFAVINSLMSIIIAPFWSAYTDAYCKEDYSWMKNTTKKLEKMWVLCLCVGIIMLLISNWVYGLWIGEDVSIDFVLSIVVMIYILSQTLGSIYLHIINGMGTIWIQMIINCIFALISWPLLTFSCRYFGVGGVALFPTIVYLTQSLFGKVQLTKILNKTAEGLWIKK